MRCNARRRRWSPSLRRPWGRGFVERARSAFIGLLGIAVAIGLGLTGLALNQGWPQFATLPLPPGADEGGPAAGAGGPRGPGPAAPAADGAIAAAGRVAGRSTGGETRSSTPRPTGGDGAEDAVDVAPATGLRAPTTRPTGSSEPIADEAPRPAPAAAKPAASHSGGVDRPPGNPGEGPGHGGGPPHSAPPPHAIASAAGPGPPPHAAAEGKGAASHGAPRSEPPSPPRACLPASSC